MPYIYSRNDIYELARVLNVETHEKGDELWFKYCPYCHGGGDDKDTFSINLESGVFHCFRSGCMKSGHFVEMARDFGFHLENDNVPKRYKRLPQKQIVVRDPAVEFMKSRGIRKETTRKYQITTRNDRDDIIVFPFYDENNVLVFVKYRNANHVKGQGPKEWCEKDAMPILFGMNHCEGFERLIICEGQVDSLSVSDCGISNAVSVPNGCNGFTFLDNVWDWIVKFQEVVVFGDCEKGKITLLDTLAKRLPVKVKGVRPEDYLGEKDANDIYRKYGKQAILTAIENAEVPPVKHVKELADVQSVDLFNLPKIRTGLKELDSVIGGLYFGQVVLLTGKRGEGKLLADDTPVFTRKGWKNHGDLQVGDEVVGRYGEWVKVTHVFPKHYANMKIKFSNGDEICCHENHEWVVLLKSGDTKKEMVLTAREMFEKIKSGYKSAISVIKKCPLNSDDVDLKVKPYTMGVWLGDGRSSNPDVCCSEKDSCVVESIIKDDGYEVSWETKHKQTGVLYYGFKQLRSELQTYGMCHSRRIVDKFIPHDYLVASKNQRLELLAGLLDTDGYYDKSRERYTFATTSVPLKDSFIDLVNTFGWKCYYTKYEPKVSSSGIVGRKPVYSINFIPTGEQIPCRVLRKNSGHVVERRSNPVTIRSIEYCEHKPGNCIEVEGGIYCAGKTMIPTHNSTLLSQLLVEAMDQNYSIFAYSGELADYHFKRWMDFQAAGPEFITTQKSIYGEEYYQIPNDIVERINAWYRGRAYIYDNNSVDDNEMESLISTIEHTIQRYDVKVIAVDNLMTAMDFTGDDIYKAQSAFVKALKNIALKYNVVVILVAHPRKTQMGGKPGAELGNDDVSGSSDITNRVDIVMAYSRNYGKTNPDDIMQADSRLSVTKNRLTGKLTPKGKGIDLFYSQKSKRISSVLSKDKSYGWQHQKVLKPNLDWLDEEE